MRAERARDIGRNIRYARWVISINMTDLAHRAGVAQSALSRCENGMRVPNAASMDAIAQVLGVPVVDLWDGPPFKGHAP